MQNYNQLYSLLNEFCKNSELTLYIHDDNQLPSLVEQQYKLNKAKIVFSPHGASGIHLICMQKGYHYIEMLSKEDINIYSRLAYFCNINYKGISMEKNIIDLDKIKKAIPNDI